MVERAYKSSNQVLKEILGYWPFPSTWHLHFAQHRNEWYPIQGPRHVDSCTKWCLKQVWLWLHDMWFATCFHIGFPTEQSHYARAGHQTSYRDRQQRKNDVDPVPCAGGFKRQVVWLQNLFESMLRHHLQSFAMKLAQSITIYFTRIVRECMGQASFGPDTPWISLGQMCTTLTVFTKPNQRQVSQSISKVSVHQSELSRGGCCYSFFLIEQEQSGLDYICVSFLDL